MFLEKPSCIRELKQLANSLSSADLNLKECIIKIKEIINAKNVDDTQKVHKIKELCKDHGK